MLRPILATAILVLLFGGVPLLVYLDAHKGELTPMGRTLVLSLFLGLMWIAALLGAAYGVVACAPPGNNWRRWWYVTAGLTCFYAAIGLFVLAVNQLLRPLVGETMSNLIYFGGTATCTLVLLNRIQRRKPS
jgi:hypothetical protein